jgi:hypothetical protein
MSRPAHLVSDAHSHPCIARSGDGVPQHVVAAGRCRRCGTTVDAAAPPADRSRRGGWLGERVVATAIGAAATALGVAYLLLASERARLAGTALLSAPSIVGTGCLALGVLLLARALR